MTLSQQEKETLSKVASSVAGPQGAVAACVYGSQVAGYARDDSDYDLIVVAKRIREGIRYRYLEEPVPSSSLVISEGLLRGDARSSYLGEFVVGRLLNVYEPLSNPGLFREVEVDYKRRVAAEALLELSSDYGEFSSHLRVPYEYFLFDKLKKRAMVYPPALYSYAQTYGGPQGEKNAAASAEGFAAAAQALADRGLVVQGDGWLRIVAERLRGDAFTRVQSLFSLTKRGVTQYAVHGYAGRVGLSVFRKEAQSKLRRMREKPSPPEALERPRSLLMLEQGRVIPDATRLEKDLARFLGFANYATTEKDLGEAYSTTRVLTFRAGARETSVVVKNFSDVRSLKWALLGVWAASANKFSMSPMARLEREYATTLKLESVGILVPKVVAVAPDERVLVKDFVVGPTLSRIIDGMFRGEDGGEKEVGSYGGLMARTHGVGVALGDAKASNVIVSEEGLFLTDLEQALQGGDKAWDVAEFLYYTAKLSTKEGPMRRVVRSFLSSYVASGERGVIARAAGSKYFRPFQPFLAPGMSRMLKEELSAFSRP